MGKKTFPSALHIFLVVLSALGLGFLHVVAPAGYAQKITKHDIEQGRDILCNVKSEFMKNYYDPTFHGMDIYRMEELRKLLVISYALCFIIHHGFSHVPGQPSLNTTLL